MLPPGIVLVSSTLNVFSNVLLILIIASCSSDYDTIEGLNWAEIVDGRVDSSEATIQWCSQFYDRQLCLGMEIDVHLGTQRTAFQGVVRSAVSVILESTNVTAYSQQCAVPDGGRVCDGCANAADVITTFLVLGLVGNIASLWANYNQVIAHGATRPTRIINGAGNAVAGVSALVMISTFEQDCYRRLPDHLSPKHGACVVFAAFVFLFSIAQLALSATVTEDGRGVESRKAARDDRERRNQASGAAVLNRKPSTPRRKSSMTRVAPSATAVPVEAAGRKEGGVSGLGKARRVSVGSADGSGATGGGAIHAKFARRGSTSMVDTLQTSIAEEMQQPNQSKA